MGKEERRRKTPKRRPRCAEVVIGITDLTREEWERLRERSDDAAGGYETYEDWLAEQENVIHKLTEMGYEPLKVPVKVDELEQWLEQQNLSNTSESRAHYVGLVVREIARGSDDPSNSSAG